MNMQVENKIQFRLFVGCLMTSELRLQLDQSHEWKQAKIGPLEENNLVETHFHEKNYIGFFLVNNHVTLSELRQVEDKIFKALNAYCPQFASEKIRVLVFSQIFIS